MAKMSAAEREHSAQIRAHRSMFGCGNGGRIFDESMDPTEMASVLTDEERQQIKLGECYACPCEILEAIEEQQQNGYIQ